MVTRRSEIPAGFATRKGRRPCIPRSDQYRARALLPPTGTDTRSGPPCEPKCVPLSRNHSVESAEPSAEGLITEQALGITPASEPITGGSALATRHSTLVCIVAAQVNFTCGAWRSEAFSTWKSSAAAKLNMPEMKLFGKVSREVL